LEEFIEKSIIAWILISWFAARSIIRKEYKYIPVLLLLVLLKSTGWPFFLDDNLAFGILGISLAISMGLEYQCRKNITFIPGYILGLFAIAGHCLWIFFVD